MRKVYFVKFLVFTCALFLAVSVALAQEKSAVKSQEVSDADGIPVLLKHLPDWETVRNGATHTNNVNDLRQALSERPVFDLIDFTGGTEAVTAPYEQGKLLIIEYNTPQGSVEADEKFNQRLSELKQNPPIFYRRIGNYNAFVFDAPDEAAANFLLEQVKYQKHVQWLGTDPFSFKRAERAFIETTSDLFVSTTLAIVGGLGLSILVGIAVGFIFFYIRDQKRSSTAAFSDAGGMTRLNLDELTSPITGERLLKE
jgi:hypothetical protein